MTDLLNEILTDMEQEILDDPLPPHLNRWDVEDPPKCHFCPRPARYALLLGRCIDERGIYKKDVCDACLERYFGDIDTPLAARIYED